MEQIDKLKGITPKVYRFPNEVHGRILTKVMEHTLEKYKSVLDTRCTDELAVQRQQGALEVLDELVDYYAMVLDKPIHDV